VAVKYDKGQIHRDLIQAAYGAAGELTGAFFAAVSNDAPVEDGHLHQTFGIGLRAADLPETEPVVSGLLSKGSGDKEATQRGYGSTTELSNAVQVVVGTSVGFVQDLNDGMIFEPDVNGSKGYKAFAVKRYTEPSSETIVPYWSAINLIAPISVSK